MIVVHHTTMCYFINLQRANIETLWSLHTQAKSRDHEIVRAQMKVSRGHPNTPPILCSVVTDPQV
jgi:hypothetical protein